MSDDRKSFFVIRALSKTWSSCKVLDNIELEIDRSMIISVLGPSGTGKSTLLRIIAGLEEPDQGELYIEGASIKHIKAEGRPVVMMFQQPLLFPQMQVIDNVTYALKVGKKKKIDKKLIKAKGNELLKKLGMLELAKRYPHELSGGQQQRVALARALAAEPKLLLLDEPFASLDADLRGQVRDWVQEVLRELAVTTLFVTHDREEAMLMGDEVIIINDGKIVQRGKPLEVYNNPCCSFVAEFYCDGFAISEQKFIPANKLIIRNNNVEANCLTKIADSDYEHICIVASVQAEVIKHGQLFVKLLLANQKNILLAYDIKQHGELKIGSRVELVATKDDIIEFK